MRRFFTPALLLLGFSALLATAAEYPLNQEDDQRQQCAGMYSKKAWGGDTDPYIEVKLNTKTDDDQIVSLLIFEWEDGPFLGRCPEGNDCFSEDKKYICKDETVKMGLCNSTDIGKFITEPNTNSSSGGSIYTVPINLKGGNAPPVKMDIKKTGYYCVQTFGLSAPKYDGVVLFQNSYGELPGSQIAKLPFYGGLTIVYSVVAAFWAFLYVQHRRDILAVQNYITATIIFLVVEMLITWAFYEYTNNKGGGVGSKILMILVAILNAGRNSLSFFLLLIVCMGYGVVKPTLGSTMTLVRGLAIAHFFFGVVYSIASLTISPDSAGPIVLLVILPLAATLTAFYIWTLNSLNLTMKELEARKQHTKFSMYKRLWWVLLGSIIIIFAFFFLNSLIFAGHGSRDFAPTHWKTRWFVLDGWLNLVYLVDLCVIAYIWRPTANNRRFAMSDELAQDDDGFEIASMAGSEDEETGHAGRSGNRNRGDSLDYSHPSASAGGSSGNRGGMPAAKPSTRKNDGDLERGEAVFSVGDHDEEDDDDNWSNGSSRDSEDGKKGLTKK